MQVRSAVVCDFAQVREGLLTIISAGITRLWRDDFPGPANIFFAAQIELDAQDRLRPHEIEVVFRGPDGEELAKLKGGFQVGLDAQISNDDTVLIPIPMDCRGATLKLPGWHEFAIMIDQHQMAAPVRVLAVKGKPQQATAPPNPIASALGRQSKPN
jgi:hypothetical protein